MHKTSRNAVLDELADPSRRHILELLRVGPQSVNALVEQTGLKQPNVSNHLGRLRERGMVTARRAGRQIIYSLADPIVEALLHTALSAIPFPPDEIPDVQIDDWSRRFRESLLLGDEAAAARVVSEALSMRLALEDLFVDILQPALVTVGHQYEAGEVSVADEHAATAITERLMARVSHFYAAGASSERTAVVGCVEGNWHSLGSRMVSDTLVQNGWRSVYLGANVPTESFLGMVVERWPDLVIISAMLPEQMEAVRLLVGKLRKLRADDKTPLIGVGGGWFAEHPEDAMAAGADFTAADVKGLISALEQLA